MWREKNRGTRFFFCSLYHYLLFWEFPSKQSKAPAPVLSCEWKRLSLGRLFRDRLHCGMMACTVRGQNNMVRSSTLKSVQLTFITKKDKNNTERRGSLTHMYCVCVCVCVCVYTIFVMERVIIRSSIHPLLC